MPNEDIPISDLRASDLHTSELHTKVRRSIFISQELEASLARLAEERGTTVNDLISDLLTRGVATLEGGSDRQPG